MGHFYFLIYIFKICKFTHNSLVLIIFEYERPIHFRPIRELQKNPERNYDSVIISLLFKFIKYRFTSK